MQEVRRVHSWDRWSFVPSACAAGHTLQLSWYREAQQGPGPDSGCTCGAMLGVKEFISTEPLCWSWALHPPWGSIPAPAAPCPGEPAHTSCKQGSCHTLSPPWGTLPTLSSHFVPQMPTWLHLVCWRGYRCDLSFPSENYIVLGSWFSTSIYADRLHSRDITHQTASCSAIKAGKRRRGIILRVTACASLINCYGW